MPNIVFKNSDFTNSRELIYKLNSLTPSGGGQSNFYEIACTYSNGNVTGYNPAELNYAALYNKVSEGYNVCIKMNIADGTPYTEYLFLSDISTSQQYFIFTSTLSKDTSAPLYYYELRVNNSGGSLIVANKNTIKGAEYIYALLSGSTVTTTVTTQDIANVMHDGILPILEVSEHGASEYYSLEMCDGGANWVDTSLIVFAGTPYIITRSGVTYFEYKRIIFDGNNVTFEYNSTALQSNSSYIETTYSQLVTAINNNNLSVGCTYVITDYSTTTTAANTQAANHDFKLAVKAVSTNQLSPEAHAIPLDDDIYFTNCDMSKWKILYDYKNDTTAYSWADTVNGKGVIYRMEDEYGNECPYDFKNILFKRWALSSSYFLYNSYFPYKSYSSTHEVTNTSDFVWMFTFSEITTPVSAEDIMDDATVNANCSTKNNKIYKPNTTNINNIVFASVVTYPAANNILTNCTDLTVWVSFSNNNLTNVHSCIINNDVKNNSLLNIASCDFDWDFKNNVVNNANNSRFYSNFKYNTVVNNFSNNTIGSQYQYCVFENVANTTFNTPSNSQIVKNLYVKSGINGETFSASLMSGFTNRNYETIIAKNSEGNIRYFCLADLIINVNE